MKQDAYGQSEYRHLGEPFWRPLSRIWTRTDLIARKRGPNGAVLAAVAAARSQQRASIRYEEAEWRRHGYKTQNSEAEGKEAGREKEC